MKKYLGIDMGGSSVKGGIVTEKGEVLYEERLRMGKDTPAETLRQFLKKFDGWKYQSAAIAVAGAVKDGKLVFSPNLRTDGVWDVARDFREWTGKPCSVTNDADAAAFGEWKWGAGKNFRDFLLVTLGTGVGAAAILNGKPYRPLFGAGLEVGHMIIQKNGRQCRCGAHGCLEAYVGTEALKKDTLRALGGGYVTNKTAFDLYDTNENAKRTVDHFLKNLCCGLTNLINLFRPQAILLGGGISYQLTPFFERMQTEANRAAFAYGKLPVTKILPARLGNRAGYLGAVCSTLKRGYDK